MAPVILLTRPDPDAARFAAALRETLGAAEIVQAPMQRIVPVDDLAGIEGADGLIFTSRNAVRTYAEAGLAPLPCYCVGSGTADLARRAGMTAISADGDARTLVDRMTRDNPPGLWLHLHGAHLSRDIAADLCAAGLNVAARMVYRQEAVPMSNMAKTLLAGRRPVIVPLFSPRSAKLFFKGANPSAPTYIVAMSAAVAQACDPLDRTKCTIAEHPDMRSMVKATVASYLRASRVEGNGTSK